jgi:hypothetical protein
VPFFRVDDGRLEVVQDNAFGPLTDGPLHELPAAAL